MPLPSLLLFERTGSWAQAIRRDFTRSGLVPVPKLLECRSTTECRGLIRAASPVDAAAQAVLVAESTLSGVGDVCELLQEHLWRFPRVPRFVVGEASDVDYEPLYRECGAIALLTSPRALRPLVDVYRRYCDQLPTLSPPYDSEKPRPITEYFQATLPWGRVAR